MILQSDRQINTMFRREGIRNPSWILIKFIIMMFPPSMCSYVFETFGNTTLIFIDSKLNDKHILQACNLTQKYWLQKTCSVVCVFL